MGDGTAGSRPERELVVDDPQLSPEANKELTEEARKALGAKQVPTGSGSDGSAGLRGSTDSQLTATLAHNRLIVALGLFVALLVGVIASLAADNWIFLAVAVFAHAAVSVVWAFLFIQAAGEPEHAAPEVAARLEEEGVSDPDARLSEMVRDVQGGGASYAESEPATSMEESAPAFMIWLPAAGLLVVSALTPFVTDGHADWLVPAVLWPLTLGTLYLAWRRPRGSGTAISEHPRAFAGAVASGVIGITLVMIGVVVG